VGLLGIHYRYDGDTDENRPANVVLIVLDALSTRYLEPYDGRAETPIFDQLADEGVLYKNMITNRPYTNEFFRTFFSGRLDRSYTKDFALSKKRENLLSLLQANGINVRWSTFHNNGVPDSRSQPT